MSKLVDDLLCGVLRLFNQIMIAKTSLNVTKISHRVTEVMLKMKMNTYKLAFNYCAW